MSGTDSTENRQHDQAGRVLAPLPEDQERALAVVAHPDDLEYGASTAVARWTAMGKDVRNVLATRGEAGIDSMPPSEAGPLRQTEQVSASAAVGVSVVEFLDHQDDLVANGIELRRDLAAAIRRHQPEVIIGSNYRDRWGDSGPWNHVDHRELGRALPDADRDAANQIETAYIDFKEEPDRREGRAIIHGDRSSETASLIHGRGDGVFGEHSPTNEIKPFLTDPFGPEHPE